MISDSIGIFVLAYVGVIIYGLRPPQYGSLLSKLVVNVESIYHDVGIDWDFCFGICRRDNLWLETSSVWLLLSELVVFV